jgi:hypothetical protein
LIWKDDCQLDNQSIIPSYLVTTIDDQINPTRTCINDKEFNMSALQYIANDYHKLFFLY